MTEAQLRTELMNGKTLAQVAKDKGKSVDGLVNALVADAKTRIDAAVKAGRLTQAQADQVLVRPEAARDRPRERRARPEHLRGFRHGGADFGGPPAFGPPPSAPPAYAPPA